jgi:hypothetical protein
LNVSFHGESVPDDGPGGSMGTMSEAEILAALPEGT